MKHQPATQVQTTTPGTPCPILCANQALCLRSETARSFALPFRVSSLKWQEIMCFFSHAHKTVSWHLSGVHFKMLNKQPPPIPFFYLGVSPGHFTWRITFLTLPPTSKTFRLRQPCETFFLHQMFQKMAAYYFCSKLSIITFNQAAVLFYLQDSIEAKSQSSLRFAFCDKKIVDNRKNDEKSPEQSSLVRSTAHPIDRASRIVFPLAFYFFVFIYCLVFVIL